MSARPNRRWARWLDRHRRSLFFLAAIFVAGGILTAFRLPVALFPLISFPRVVISLEAGDRPAEEMAALVTYPVEEAAKSVPGARSVRSSTSRGGAEVSVSFDWGLDMTTATLRIQAALAQLSSSLPPGTSAEVRRMDPTVFPVIGYSLTSALRSDTQLYDLAYYQLRPRLSTVSGVAKVAVLGGSPEEVHVIASPAQLERYGLSLDELSQALSASNVVQAAGVLEDDSKLYLVLTDDRFGTVKELEETVLRTGRSGFVRLGDVATVARAAEPKRTVVTADGRPAVLFQIYQQPGGNTVQIAQDVKEVLAEAAGVIPEDVHVASWYDQSDLISASARSVRDAILIGIALSMLVLFAFLRDLRVTLIAALVVPSVLASTALVLGVLGQSFNLMTLGGLAAAVGLVIDDAIVMVEHLVRRREELAAGRAKADDLLSAAEFTRPLVGSSLATIVIFVPLAFLSGVTGAFFRALSLTMAVALVISFLVAWLLVPLLAGWLLEARGDRSSKSGSEASSGAYGRLLTRLLKRPALVLLGVGPLLLLGYLGFRSLGSGFMPVTDEGGFILDYRAAPGTSLTETDRILRQLEAILRATPEVSTYSRRTGLQLGGGLTESNEGDFFVRLHPPPRRNIEAVMDDLRSQIAEKVPGLEIELLQLMEDLIGDLTAVPQPIEVKIFADDGAVLEELAPKIAAGIGAIAGVVDVNPGIIPAGDALVVRVDRDQAALEGVDPGTVAQSLSDLVAGSVTTSLAQGEKVINVRVWVPASSRNGVWDLSRLFLHAPDGHRFPLSRIAVVTRVSGQPQINRDNLKRMAAVTGRIAGRDLGSTIRDVRAFVDRKGTLPDGVYYRLGGLYEQQQIAFRGLVAVLASAVLLVFLVLLFLYERFSVAVAVLLTAGLALTAVFLGLWITGTELDISAMMGLTMIVGIVTEVSVFYVTEARELESVIRDDAERLVEAGRNRMRPIAMTTLAAFLALLPLALGIGEGSGMLRPLAVAIEAGLVAQLPVVLLVLPVLLHRFASHGRRTLKEAGPGGGRSLLPASATGHGGATTPGRGRRSLRGTGSGASGDGG